MTTHDYAHRQIGATVLAVVILLAIVPLRHFVYAAAYRHANVLTVLAIVALVALLAVGILFSSFTVQVMHDHLVWSFGPGFFRHAVAVERIVDARRCRNPWLQGLGIRTHDGARIYAVAGGSAVELELADGQRIRLGTNEPDRLIRALGLGES